MPPALIDDGRVVVGCNVENASYGLTLCAECALVSALHTTRRRPAGGLACVDGRRQPLMPCGRCRQLLWEHGGAGMLLDTARGVLADGPRCCPTPSAPATSPTRR